MVPHDEIHVIETSLQEMLNALDDAALVSVDAPDHPPVQLSQTIHTGQRGRPRMEIDPNLLGIALSMRGPTHLAPLVGCSARTVRRRALEHGLVEPGPPVYVDFVDENGDKTRFYTQASKDHSGLSDDDLDSITREILEVFPRFGRRMIDGHMRFLGHRIPRRRIHASYTRVHGPPTGSFGPRRIQRRVYKVAGPNSLSHHDGQHGQFFLFCHMSHCSE